MNTIIVHPDSEEKWKALKAFMTALNIPFELPSKEKPYNKDFVTTILEAEKDIKKGKGTKMASKDIDNLWK
jgi:hypothetical protein